MKQTIPDSDQCYKNKILASSMLGLGLEGMDIMFFSFALTTISREFGITPMAAGSIASITNIGMLVGGILFGILADKYGRIKMFTYTIFIFAIATACIGFMTNIHGVYIARFFAGLGAGGEYGIGMTLIAEVFPKEKRGRMSSLVTIGGQMGVALAAIISAIVLPLLGWRALFIIGIFPVFLAFYVRRHLGETSEWIAEKRKEKNDGTSTNIRILFDSPKRTCTTIGLTIMATVQVAGYYGLMTWLPSIFQKQLDLTEASSSLWMISTVIGMCCGMLLFGQIMDRLGAKISYGLFLLASAASVYLYVCLNNYTALLIGGAIVGFFANGMSAGYGALISSYYPAVVRSTANNVIFNMGRAIGGLSPIMIGYLLGNGAKNIANAMGFLSILYIISFLVIMNLRDNPLKGSCYSK